MKIEIFYLKEKDAVLMVQDGELKYYDPYIESCEYLSYFGIDNVDEYANLSAEEIIKGFDDIMADFKYNSPSEVDGYLERVSREKIEGKLICCKYTRS